MTVNNEDEFSKVVEVSFLPEQGEWSKEQLASCVKCSYHPLHIFHDHPPCMCDSFLGVDFLLPYHSPKPTLCVASIYVTSSPNITFLPMVLPLPHVIRMTYCEKWVWMSSLRDHKLNLNSDNLCSRLIDFWSRISIVISALVYKTLGIYHNFLKLWSIYNFLRQPASNWKDY